MLKINIDRKLVNIFVLSWGFMFVFAAFQPMTNIQKNVLDEIGKETPNFTGDGYVSLGIVFAAFGSSILLSPVFATLISSRLSVLIGAICNAFFLSIFFWPEKILLYTASVIQGIGSALIWIGSELYITENSNLATITRNSGIFWSIYQLSLVIGNLFIYFIFTGTSFDKTTRKTIFVTLTTFAVIGCAVLAVLRKPSKMDTAKNIATESSDPLYSAWLRMKNALILVTTSNMAFLSITFLYTGLIFTLTTGVYTSSVGFTVKMGESRRKLVSITGIAIGIGEGMGAILSGPIASRFQILSRSVIVGLGFFVHIICYAIIFFNFPNNAPFEDTEDTGLITPLPILAIIGGIMLGFGDACYNTPTMSIIGTLYAKEIVPAFACYSFCQNLTITISFIYSNYFGLNVQLIILIVFAIFGTASFVIVDVRTKKMGNCNLTENNIQENPENRIQYQ